MNDSDTKFHPVQTHQGRQCRGKITTKVTVAAYEVYCHVYAPQEAMMKDGCRGGFSTGELIAFLYAKTFPKEQWKNRVHMAFEGMENL